MTRILVVDDEPQLLRALRINLAARGYEVAVADDGAAALREAADRHPDLVVLDLGLPDLDGLDAGADDYVIKPFGVDELLARIRAVSRRASVAEEEPARFVIGEHEVDLAGKTVSGGVRLTPTEWRLLEILVRNPGKLITQRRLLNDVWGAAYGKETNYLRQYMAQMRKKLERDPAHPVHLLTEPGMGYRFQP